jgi:hypothetical protein
MRKSGLGPGAVHQSPQLFTVLRLWSRRRTDYRRQAKSVKVLPLSEIVRCSSRLSDQVIFAADWVVRSFDEVVGIAP